MLANEIGDVRTARDNAKMIRAGEVERKARNLCRQTLPFKRLRHLRMKKYDAVGKTAVREHRSKAVDEHLETLSRFVVGDG